MASDDVEARIERLKNAFRAAGIKVTPQRVEIFREVVSSADHPDAEAVFSGVRRRMSMVSLDTVYRTLSLLTELGLITTLGPRRESVRFDPTVEKHHHFECAECGLVRDFQSSELDALAIPTPVRNLGTVLGTQVHVTGICSQCRRDRRK